MDTAVTAAGTALRPLRAEQLYRATDLSRLKFVTTAELEPIDGMVGQAFRQTQERLVVMTRGAFEDATTSTIAAARRVPVLVIEPPTGAKLAF